MYSILLTIFQFSEAESILTCSLTYYNSTSFLKDFLLKGIPMKAIQEWLGHSNFSTTANIYAHLDSNSKQLSAQVITSAFETKKEIEESDSTISYDELALEN